MWFKKKAHINGYKSNTAVDGTDWRTTSKNQYWSASLTLPSATDAGNYFYLPALGYYTSGQLIYGGGGYYWSSSANPGPSDLAYILSFGGSRVYVDHYRRYLGIRVGGFE